jgi:putative ABC transport system substrate-binding protein
MRRREFVTLLGGAGATWPLAARAQQSVRPRHIGILFSGFSEADPEPKDRVAAFKQELNKLGWIEGQEIQFDLRVGAGDANRVSAHADELIGMMPDVLAANGAPAVFALARRTKSIPIVFANFLDPVSSGIVASLPPFLGQTDPVLDEANLKDLG